MTGVDEDFLRKWFWGGRAKVVEKALERLLDLVLVGGRRKRGRGKG